MATPEQLRSLTEEATCLEPPRAPMAGPPEQDQRWLSLAEEATCPICLGHFAEPVVVQCGHTFCTPCITRYWEGVVPGGPYPCPQCREAAPTNTLRPNRHLASMVQILAQGVPPVAPPREGPQTGGHLMCTEHDEKLKLFCQEDQTPICVICRESRGHRAHTVTPIREAAQEYKEKFQSYLEDAKRQLENIIGLQHKEEAKLKDTEVNSRMQRDRITSVFNEVQKFLEKEKCRHLSNVEEKEKRTLQRIQEKLSELEKQQASVRDQITEIELKCQQPDVELLKDVTSILSRFEKVKSQPPDSGNFKEKEKESAKDEEEVKKVEEERKVQEEDKKEEQEDAEEGDGLMLKIIESLEWRWARSYAGEVTLDPDTAHKGLVLSEDGRSVSLGDRAQDLPDRVERYDLCACVLGRERLSSGRHYWEVELEDMTDWDLGVCDESVSRKGAITLSPEDGYWTLWLRDGEYKALTSHSTPLTPSVPPRVVGLFLDYEAGRVSLYNVTDRSLLYTFSEASFPHTLRPYLGSEFSNGGKKGGALRVLPVTEQE